MALPMLSGVLKTVSQPFEWFLSVIPKPVKWIVFLLFIVTLGGIVTDVFVGNSYGCDNTCQLVDNREFSNCLAPYIAGRFWKLNLSQTECWQMPQASDPSWNQTVCNEYIPKVNTVALVEYSVNVITNLPLRLLNWFQTLFFPVENRTSIYDYISDQGRIVCEDLYNCLSPETRFRLNVTEGCRILKGNTSDDHFPTMEQYTYWTRFNKTKQADIDEFKLFSIQCYDFGSTLGCSPEVSFFGIPILRYEFWIIITILGFFLWIISKL